MPNDTQNQNSQQKDDNLQDLSSITGNINSNSPSTDNPILTPDPVKPLSDFPTTPQPQPVISDVHTNMTANTLISSVLNPAPPTQNMNNLVPTSNTPPSMNGSDDPTVTSPHVPKKYGGKKIIATIFSVLFIVGAIAAGVILVQRQQLLEQEASEDHKIDICHIPPGNTENPQIIDVDKNSWKDGHSPH